MWINENFCESIQSISKWQPLATSSPTRPGTIRLRAVKDGQKSSIWGEGKRSETGCKVEYNMDGRHLDVQESEAAEDSLPETLPPDSCSDDESRPDIKQTTDFQKIAVDDSLPETMPPEDQCIAEDSQFVVLKSSILKGLVPDTLTEERCPMSKCSCGPELKTQIESSSAEKSQCKTLSRAQWLGIEKKGSTPFRCVQKSGEVKQWVPEIQAREGCSSEGYKRDRMQTSVPETQFVETPLIKTLSVQGCSIDRNSLGESKIVVAESHEEDHWEPQTLTAEYRSTDNDSEGTFILQTILGQEAAMKTQQMAPWVDFETDCGKEESICLSLNQASCNPNNRTIKYQQDWQPSREMRASDFSTKPLPNATSVSERLKTKAAERCRAKRYNWLDTTTHDTTKKNSSNNLVGEKADSSMSNVSKRSRAEQSCFNQHATQRNADLVTSSTKGANKFCSTTQLQDLSTKSKCKKLPAVKDNNSPTTVLKPELSRHMLKSQDCVQNGLTTAQMNALMEKFKPTYTEWRSRRQSAASLKRRNLEEAAERRRKRQRAKAMREQRKRDAEKKKADFILAKSKLAPIALSDSWFEDYDPPDAFFQEIRDQSRKERMAARRKTAQQRRQMVGHDCACCRPYYDALNLSPDSRARRVNESSRHRSERVRSPTPEGYWNPLIPSFSHEDETNRKG